MNIHPDESGLSLPTLLSQVLVAFTIEFDNEFERQMPHRTTHGPKTASRGGPWLVSLVMWSNCMQFIGEQGLSVGELERLARTRTNLNGMERWGYIVVEPGPREQSPDPRHTQEADRLRSYGGPSFTLSSNAGDRVSVRSGLTSFESHWQR